MMTAAPTPRLTRAAHYQPRWLRRALGPAVFAALAWRILTHTPELDCAAAARGGGIAIAVTSCEREFLRTNDPMTGARLAEAERRAGNHAVAGALANGLLVTTARADALWVLGAIALSEGRLDVARTALRNARDLHRADGRAVEQARDERALARAERQDTCTFLP